jgi:Double zinc ribbon
MAETCPACGAEGSGRFCNQCGAALQAACRECGTPLPRGARFCNECGAGVSPAASGAAPKPSPLPWVVSGVALAALAAVLLVPAFRGGSADGEAEAPAPFAQAPAAAPGAPAPAAGGAQGGPPDLSSMTPREAADRLFNRVMTAVSAGDTAQARQFQPMAVMAYGRVEELDSDGRYHLAALHLVGGDFAAARAEAERILSGNPAHLFGLFTAAQAAEGAGNTGEAAALYRRFVDAYTAESSKPLPEYRDHAQALPSMLGQAQQRAAAAR